MQGVAEVPRHLPLHPQFYERDTRKPESMFHLLTWMQLEGPHESHDSVQWHRLDDLGRQGTRPAPDDLRLPPVSRPTELITISLAG